MMNSINHILNEGIAPLLKDYENNKIQIDYVYFEKLYYMERVISKLNQYKNNIIRM